MLNLKLPEELENRLEDLSIKTRKSKSFYIREALKLYLEENDDASVALERLNDKNAEYLNHEEAKKYLGL
ncbi:MAG: ribbon-helix-helix domain-containing protein [Candidatus Acidulodesulfobacterium ferriphilum]|jgi:Ribbon-helix-helix protein, copG family.|uniref:Ribbon-helix-helix domain-containing protein n=1 Tax=Candidatus Acidulodesulfobacterium ferriphilum TaxID=2597223 RepID=A0A519BAB0_9DELT|nr:MAG: ribbon-helix-helix domain-containing protein [Candidatus Acidulodesulfobacterium ferriphilum]